MRVVTGQAQRGPYLATGVVLGALALLAVTVASNAKPSVVAPGLALIVTVAVLYRRVFSWPWLLALILLVIIFIPIRRYSLPASLPFNLEPYRAIVGLVALGWLTSLLIDKRVRLRPSVVDAPIFLFVIVCLLSLIVNRARVESVGPDVVKRVMFFASFLLLFYLVLSVTTRFRDIDFLVRVLVAGGSVLAVFAIIEARTGYNVFNYLSTVIPVLKLNPFAVPDIYRGARLRVYASAQHPIALGAAFAMLVPLALYRARCYGEKRWWLAAGILTIAALSTVSRTAIIMLGVVGLVFIMLRPELLKRLWPAAIPALIVVHFAIPGTLGTIKASLFPKGGLIAQQQNASVGSGRLATLGPALDAEFKPNPLLGEGFGTRVTVADEVVPVPNAPITDDQWLGILLETGIAGAFAFLWIFVRFFRRIGKEAKIDPSPRGWLLVALTASVAAFGVGMFFYDAFSFIQITFLFFILLALGVAAARVPPEEAELAPRVS